MTFYLYTIASKNGSRKGWQRDALLSLYFGSELRFAGFHRMAAAVFFILKKGCMSIQRVNAVRRGFRNCSNMRATFVLLWASAETSQGSLH